MNELILKEYNSEHVVYLYQPDGEGEYGEIEYVFSEDNAKVIKQSMSDDIGRYGFKAAKAVKECVVERNLPLEFTQAWG